MNGSVRFFASQRGYGSISSESGDEIYVHHIGVIDESLRSKIERQARRNEK